MFIGIIIDTIELSLFLLTFDIDDDNNDDDDDYNDNDDDNNDDDVDDNDDPSQRDATLEVQSCLHVCKIQDLNLASSLNIRERWMDLSE